jgi:hypothetical protein
MVVLKSIQGEDYPDSHRKEVKLSTAKALLISKQRINSYHLKFLGIFSKMILRFPSLKAGDQHTFYPSLVMALALRGIPLRQYRVFE